MTPLIQQQVALAERHFQTGKLQLSEDLLHQVIDRDPTVARAYELLAYIRGNRGQFEACEELLSTAAELPDCPPEVLFYLGRVQLQRGRAREAAASFEHCIEEAEAFESLHELGVAYGALGNDEKALAAFRRAERKNPRSPEVQANMGDCLAALLHFGEALSRYDQALALDPRLPRAWSGRGDALASLHRLQEALDSYGRALTLAPGDSGSWMRLATTLMLMERHAEALAAYEKVGQLAPDTDYLCGTWLLASMYMGRWEGWTQRFEDAISRVDAGRKAAPPFSLMATPAGPATLLRSARTYSQDQCPSQSPVEFKAGVPGRKLRVGYFSNDFRNHATSHLMARLFECHDRSRFEWFGFSIGQHPPDAMSARVAAGFDHFEQVGEQHDAQIAARARELEIDIAVDLNGHTTGSRPNIFAGRAAPLQVNYLGFPGTMGCDYIDYIIADTIVIPPDDYRHYVEKVVVLPGSYQVNDDTKRISENRGSRESHGLPPQGFVFACFNNGYKLTPDLFDVWIRLLQKIPGSVLWLLKGSAGAQANLMSEAQARGVEPSRIVWAPRMEVADHLARHAHADLFLDSFYYNAHTTSSDALWAGLPVLTLAGSTFASRVSGSLLHAIGLPELITSSVAEYEARALELAASPSALTELRERLWVHRTTMPLFDTRLFARRIETAFESMWARRRDGLTPDHIQITDHAASTMDRIGTSTHHQSRQTP